jgi:phosphoribosyl-ATP pyrophosphohydrolase/phosphoribosyl-AMP cyclohydrolase
MKFKQEDVKFDGYGLVAAIVQDVSTLEVLMLGYMNAESLRRTLETGETWFWSRSRNALWHKGATSGNAQRVVNVKLDCDRDALVVSVVPAGPACHTGARTCFHNQIEGCKAGAESRAEPERLSKATSLGELLDELYALIERRREERPDASYTTYLFNEGLDKILAKVEEEAAETVVAGKSETDQRLIEETSDLIYHLTVLLVERGVTLAQIQDELIKRRGKQNTK